MAHKTHPCPRCGRTLQASGEVTMDDVVSLTYSCDECLDPLDLGDETMELPLTFCVDPDGRVFNAADPDRVLDAGDSGAVSNQ